MAFQKAIAGILLLFTISCSTGYDLSKIPQYNIKEADAKYKGIHEAEIAYLALSKALYQLDQLGIVINKEKLLPIIDKYIYWISVAKIQIFFGDYDKSNKSLKNAIFGLEQLEAVIIEEIKSNSL